MPPTYRPGQPVKPMSKKTKAAVVSSLVIALGAAGTLAPPPFNVLARAAAAIVGLFQ
jgi:hypothetical protein